VSVGATVTPVVPTLSNIPLIIVGGNEMTRLEALRRTVELCDALMARQLEDAELLLVDHRATEDELRAALGPDGYARKMFREGRDAHIAVVATWLACGDDTLH
jgi:hypothetical protein